MSGDGPILSDGATLVAVLGRLRARDAEPLTLPILHPAEPFLDLAGEDLRRRILLADGARGETLALRPEFTIPVARHHIGHVGVGSARRYALAGTVFRQASNGPGEALQAGIEAIGDASRPEADARAIADALVLVSSYRAGARAIVGDQAIFEAVTESLGLPAVWFHRLVRQFGDHAALDAALDALDPATGDRPVDAPETGLGADASPPDPVRDALEAGDEATLTHAIGQVIERTRMGLGARNASEIAARLLARRDLEHARLASDQSRALRAFLALDVPLPELRVAVGALGLGGPSLSRTLDDHDARSEALRGHGLDPATIRFRGALGRPLDYYTGVVFEVAASGDVVAGGGRYDGLLELLGADDPVPAVGFALYMDRLLATEAGR